jgi:hypothetical protein
LETANQITPAKVQPRGLTRKRDQAIRRYVSRLKVICPHLDSPAFAATLRAFAEVNILLEAGYAFLREQGVTSTGLSGTEIRSSYDAVRRMADTAARLAGLLGLTPGTLRALSREKVINPLEGD